MPKTVKQPETAAQLEPLVGRRSSSVPVLDSLSREQWDKLLPKMTYRERETCRLRYGGVIGDGFTYTLEECGRIFKVTRERIRSILSKAEIKAATMFGQPPNAPHNGAGEKP